MSIDPKHAERIRASHELSSHGIIGKSIIFYVGGADEAEAGETVRKDIETTIGSSVAIGVVRRISNDPKGRFGVQVASDDPHKLVSSILDAGSWRE
jgi:hypothetical protein